MGMRRFGAGRLLLLGAMALAVLGAVAGCGGDPPPSPLPHGLPPLALPADEAPHDFRTEWWYFNIHAGEEGGSRRFALHYVLFQVREQVSGRTLYVAQAGLTEASGDAHHKAERFRTTEQPIPGRENGFDFTIGDWQFAGDGGESFTLRGGVEDSRFDLDLTGGAPLLHDDDGLVDFKEAGITYYFSRPRLEVRGVVTLPSGPVNVSGLAWYDKQWGDFQPVAVSWDWASMQLDDGRNLMLTRLFDGFGASIYVYGTLQQRDGQVRRLSEGDFAFEPAAGSAWTSPDTGASYDARWRVRVPSEDIDAELVPIAAALASQAEFRSNALGVVYWEAGVDVITSDGARIGQGFVELAGRTGLAVR